MIIGIPTEQQWKHEKKIVLLSISTATTARDLNEVFVIPDIKMI